MVVEAPTATDALRIAWGLEDDRDLRDVKIEWLTPVDCIQRDGDKV